MKALICIYLISITLNLSDSIKLLKKEKELSGLDLLANHDSKPVSREKRNVGPAGGWNPNLPNDGMKAPVLRNTFCDPETSSVGKRGLSAKVDSFPELNEYYLNDYNSDIKLNVSGTEVPAHKFVLSAKSPTFAEILREKHSENEIDLDVESIDAFRIMLKYLYSEKFLMDNETDYEMAFEVFELAQRFQVIRLMSIIEQSLARMIHFNNYIEIYKFAEKHELKDLIKSWMSFVFANSNAIMANQLFLNESLEICEKILFSLNAEQRFIIMSIKKILEMNPDLDVKRFAKLIFIERCDIDDLVELRALQMFDDRVLFEEIVRRYRFLHSNCNDRLQRRNFPFMNFNPSNK